MASNTLTFFDAAADLATAVDTRSVKIEQYTKILQAWQSEGREEFAKAAVHSTVVVEADYDGDSPTHQSLVVHLKKVEQFNYGAKLPPPTEFGNLQPLAFAGDVTLANGDMNGTILVKINGEETRIPRMWVVRQQLGTMKAAKIREMQYTLERYTHQATPSITAPTLWHSWPASVSKCRSTT